MRIHHGGQQLETIIQVFSISEIEHLKTAVNAIVISTEMEDYFLKIARKTRDLNNIELGVSPRVELTEGSHHRVSKPLLKQKFAF